MRSGHCARRDYNPKPPTVPDVRSSIFNDQEESKARCGRRGCEATQSHQAFGRRIASDQRTERSHDQPLDRAGFDRSTSTAISATECCVVLIPATATTLSQPTLAVRFGASRSCQNLTHTVQQKNPSFDYLVGAGEEHSRLCPRIADSLNPMVACRVPAAIREIDLSPALAVKPRTGSFSGEGDPAHRE